MIIVLLSLWMNAFVVQAWAPNYIHGLSRHSNEADALASMMHLSKLDGDNVEDDWRDFRAQLVRSEKRDTTTSSKDRQQDEDHWAYETGDVSRSKY